MLWPHCRLEKKKRTICQVLTCLRQLQNRSFLVTACSRTAAKSTQMNKSSCKACETTAFDWLNLRICDVVFIVAVCLDTLIVKQQQQPLTTSEVKPSRTFLHLHFNCYSVC